MVFSVKNSLKKRSKTIWECCGDKSLGPDGFNFSFIKKVGR